MSHQSALTQVLNAVDRVHGSVSAKNMHHFKRLTDCSLSVRQIEAGLREGRNRGLLKLQKVSEGVTRVQRTSKNA